MNYFESLCTAIITGVVSGLLANCIYTRNQNNKRKNRLNSMLGRLTGVWEKISTELETDLNVLVYLEHVSGTTQFNGYTWYHVSVQMDDNGNITHPYSDGEKGKVSFKIWFDEISLETAVGKFQYFKPFHNPEITDKGTYKLQMDLNDVQKLIVYYENTVPNNKVNGYEEWKWISKLN